LNEIKKYFIGRTSVVLPMVLYYQRMQKSSFYWTSASRKRAMQWQPKPCHGEAFFAEACFLGSQSPGITSEIASSQKALLAMTGHGRRLLRCKRRILY